MSVKCFYVLPTGQARIIVSKMSHSRCINGNCHRAELVIDTVTEEYGEDGYTKMPDISTERTTELTHCEVCKEPFKDDTWTGASLVSLYKNQDPSDSRIYTLRENVPGMMYDAFWLRGTREPKPYANFYTGPDGLCLTVNCPNGRGWHIDSRASNCAMPNDNTHRCWVRHGTPPNITVDKAGNTCSAGAGSIQNGDYHGFLRNGQFVE